MLEIDQSSILRWNYIITSPLLRQHLTGLQADLELPLQLKWAFNFWSSCLCVSGSRTGLPVCVTRSCFGSSPNLTRKGLFSVLGLSLSKARYLERVPRGKTMSVSLVSHTLERHRKLMQLMLQQSTKCWEPYGLRAPQSWDPRAQSSTDWVKMRCAVTSRSEIKGQGPAAKSDSSSSSLDPT